MATSDSPITNALTFDIEDWFHLVEIEAVADPEKWPDFPTLVVERTRWILESLSREHTHATFFVVGWVAERYPEIAKMISAEGHELATHSYWHRRVNLLTPEEFADDVRRSIDVLQDQTGQKVRGFRAPGFSITPGTEWAFDVLADLGIEYDASLLPAKLGHGGYHCPQEIHQFTGAPSGRPMLELPMSVLSFGPWRMPFSGGGYLRLLPRWLIRHGFANFQRRSLPVVVYLHPRDFAPDCPRVPMPIHRRFKSYVGLKSTAGKFAMLLDHYKFDTCASVLGLDPADVSSRP